MFFIDLCIAAGVSFIFLALVFVPIEHAFPANPNQKIFRPQWIVDLCYFLGQYLLWNSLIYLALNYLNKWLFYILPTDFRSIVGAQPFWLQCIEVILLSDFLIYWGHRLQHTVDFLWRFHKVHHTAESMDWLAAHREHPLDTIYTVGIINLPAIVMGFNLETIVVFIAFRGIWAVYIHSNVRFPIGFLKYIIGSPEIHHWHHDKERDRGNYANVSPLMDLIFGTHVCPDHEPEAFGIKEKFPTSYLGQMLQPLLPKNTFKIKK